MTRPDCKISISIPFWKICGFAQADPNNLMYLYPLVTVSPEGPYDYTIVPRRTVRPESLPSASEHHQELESDIQRSQHPFMKEYMKEYAYHKLEGLTVMLKSMPFHDITISSPSSKYVPS